MRKVRFYHRPKNNNFTRKNLHSISILLLLCLSIMPLVPTNNNISNFTRFVFSYWTGVDKDFGKLKFVDKVSDSTLSVVGGVLQFRCPFKSASLEKTTSGETLIIGSSDMFIAVASGIVESVKTSGKERIITIDHGGGIKSIYEFEGLLCVKNNDRVENEYIGIARKKKVIVTIVSGAGIVKITGIKNELLETGL